jgi:regulator of replication initiation timing
MDVPADAPGHNGATTPAASTFAFVVPTASSSNNNNNSSSIHVKPENTTSPAASSMSGAFDDSAASLAGRKRKAASSASLRGVANLTPDQLARKRANDRQAQRAIRERTKTQIEALESRVRELSSQQPYQDLQKLVAEKDRILAENEDIRRRLSTVLGILQPLVDKPGKKIQSKEAT